MKSFFNHYIHLRNPLSKEWHVVRMIFKRVPSIVDSIYGNTYQNHLYHQAHHNQVIYNHKSYGTVKHRKLGSFLANIHLNTLLNIIVHALKVNRDHTLLFSMLINIKSKILIEKRRIKAILSKRFEDKIFLIAFIILCLFII